MPWCAVKLGAVQQVYVVLSRAPPGLGRLIFSRRRRRATPPSAMPPVVSEMSAWTLSFLFLSAS